MNRKDFHFNFPAELVAQSPLPERDSARLLYWNAEEHKREDRHFSELAQILRERFPQRDFPSILLIVNDSKVFPARVRCRKESGGRAEVFILSTRSENEIPCLLRPQKKMREGEILYVEETGEAVFEVVSLQPPKVKNISGLPLADLLSHVGEMPLPPYIERDPKKVSDPSLHAQDRMRYQTVYAKDLGSAAAPTAGLHFTPAVLEQCSKSGIMISPVTLHVGLGTFQPVTADHIDEHQIHTEICSISSGTMEQLIHHLNQGWPIFFVGTTSFRCVESVLLKMRGIDVAGAGGERRESLRTLWPAHADEWMKEMRSIADVWHETSLFIRPRTKDFVYLPSCGHGIVTNFHQPESTLAMMIAALLGYEHWRALYQHAVDQKYRLFSYGDSSLLLFPGIK